MGWGVMGMGFISLRNWELRLLMLLPELHFISILYNNTSAVVSPWLSNCTTYVHFSLDLPWGEKQLS